MHEHKHDISTSTKWKHSIQFCHFISRLLGLQEQADKFFAFYGLILLISNVALGVGKYLYNLIMVIYMVQYLCICRIYCVFHF